MLNATPPSTSASSAPLRFSSLPSRRRFVGGLGAAAACLVASPAQAQNRLEKPKLTLAVDGKAALYYLPLTLADQLGYFRAEGLDVEFADVASSANVRQLLASGGADVCAGPFEHTLHLQQKGQWVRSFVLQGRAPQCAFGVSTKLLPAIAGAADLRGKKIGCADAGSASHMFASMVLLRAGVKPGEVTFVPLATGASALAALRGGQIDALCHTEPVMTLLESRNEIKTMGDARTLAGTKAVFGGTLPAACLFAMEDFVQKMPATCQALTYAVVRTLKWLQTAGPSDIIKTVPEVYLLNDRSLYLAAFDKLRESICLDGLMPDDGPRTALGAISGFDSTVDVKTIDLQRSYTNRFAARAKQRFNA